MLVAIPAAVLLPPLSLEGLSRRDEVNPLGCPVPEYQPEVVGNWQVG
jgi:hypothetical protein